MDQVGKNVTGEGDSWIESGTQWGFSCYLQRQRQTRDKKFVKQEIQHGELFWGGGLFCRDSSEKIMCTNLRLAGNAWLVGGWGYHWDLEILESPLWSHSDHRDVQESLIEQLERSERNSRVASVQKIDSEPMKWYNLAQILQTASLSSTDCQWMFAGGNIQQKGQKLMLMDGRSYQFHPCGISWCNREIFCRKTCPVFGYMRTFF